MTKEPICSCCGGKIDGLLLDYSMRLPDNILALPHEEHKYVSHPHTALISYKDEFYVRGITITPVEDTEEYYLVYGIWVYVVEEDYKKFLNVWVESEDKTAVLKEPVIGLLANEFPHALYPDTFNLKVAIIDQPDMAARCIVEETNHPFAVEQSSSVSIDRVHEIAKIMGYES